MTMITVLNMSHPLTDVQVSQIVEIVGVDIHVVDVAVQLDLALPAA